MSEDSKPCAPGQHSGGVAFGMVQADIFRDRTLPASVKLVYVCLATYADDRRIAFPSQQTISADTGLSVRTVKRAVKIGEEIGLFEVIHTQTSNRYRLRDLRIGGYIIGSGPECHSGTPEGSDVHSGSAPVAHEQDQTTRPTTQTSFTSSDAASGAPPASVWGEIKVYPPRNFATLDDGHVAQHLVKASIAALRDAGLEPAPNAGDRLGRAIRATMERDPGLTRQALVKMVEATLALAGTSDEEWGSVAWQAAA